MLLEDADPEAFASLLALAGQAGSFLRTLDLTGHPGQLAASRAEPFCDALAAGDLELARTIARRAPRQAQVGWEYEDDFLRFHFLHRLLLGEDDEQTLARVLERWEEVLEGKGSCHLDTSRALLARDPVALDASLRSASRDRAEKLEAWRKTPVYNPELDATEGALFVAGLGVLRVGEILGLSLPEEYEFMPSLARVPMGLRLPPPDSWRQFQNALSLSGAEPGTG